MMADPTATEVINPDEFTVATPVLLEAQERVLFATLEGAIVAMI